MLQNKQITCLHIAVLDTSVFWLVTIGLVTLLLPIEDNSVFLTFYIEDKSWLMFPLPMDVFICSCLFYGASKRKPIYFQQFLIFTGHEILYNAIQTFYYITAGKKIPAELVPYSVVYALAIPCWVIVFIYYKYLTRKAHSEKKVTGSSVTSAPISAEPQSRNSKFKFKFWLVTIFGCLLWMGGSLYLVTKHMALHEPLMLSIFTCSCLFYGAFNEKRNYLMPFLNLNGFYILRSIMFTFFSHKTSLFEGSLTPFITVNIIGVVFWMYLLSYYVHLANEEQTRKNNGRKISLARSSSNTTRYAVKF